VPSSVESTVISPPWRPTTMRREMSSPSPVPWPTSLVVKNGSNTCGRTSGGMPGPVSATSTTTLSAVAEVASRIRGKIKWEGAADIPDRTFLNAYYAGLRGRLESRMLFGRRRKDKFDVD